MSVMLSVCRTEAAHFTPSEEQFVWSCASCCDATRLQTGTHRKKAPSSRFEQLLPRTWSSDHQHLCKPTVHIQCHTYAPLTAVVVNLALLHPALITRVNLGLSSFHWGVESATESQKLVSKVPKRTRHYTNTPCSCQCTQASGSCHRSWRTRTSNRPSHPQHAGLTRLKEWDIAWGLIVLKNLDRF